MTALPGKQQVVRATLAALLGNAIFGFSFMFSRMALASATPFVMLMHRFLLAFLFLNITAFVARQKNLQGWLRFRIPWRACGPLLLLGLVQPVIYFLCESYGISLTNATVSGVIIALIPIAALAAGFVFMKEKASGRQILFALVSIGGVTVMTLQQSAQGEIRALGVVLLVGAVMAGVAFNIMSRRLSGAFSPLERTYVMMLTAAAVFTVLALFECGGRWEALLLPFRAPAFLPAILYLSLFSSVIAFLCLNYAASVLPVSKTTSFANVTTVLSVFAGALFLSEPLTPVSLAASAVIIAGVVGVQKN